MSKPAETVQQMKEATAKARLPLDTGNLLANALSPKRYLTPSQAGGTWHICGAGPSLPASAHILRSVNWVDKILCTNSSARAIRSMGVYPSAVVVMEGMDVSDQIPEGGTVFAPPTTHPNVWAMTHAGIPIPAAHVASLLPGVMPVQTGVAALTAAVGIALASGADEIVLHGADLSFRDDGRTYAPGTPLGDMRVSKVEDGRITVSGDEWRRDFHSKHGVPVVPTTRDAGVRLESNNGTGAVWQTVEYQSQWLWLTALAESTGARLRNASFGGAVIPGWEMHPPEAKEKTGRTAGPQRFPGLGLTGERRMVPFIREQAIRASRHAKAMLTGGPIDWSDPGSIELMWAMATPDILTLQSIKVPPEGVPHKVRGVYEILQAAANKALSVIGAEGEAAQ